jgi:hypothetical protein
MDKTVLIMQKTMGLVAINSFPLASNPLIV